MSDILFYLGLAVFAVIGVVSLTGVVLMAWEGLKVLWRHMRGIPEPNSSGEVIERNTSAYGD